jgi:formamidopyrimidine-DNA glycosylase
MPELPDITIYVEALQRRIGGEVLERVRLASPFLVRTADPPMGGIEGQRVRELRRVGKRLCFGFENGLWAALHLMIAGRLHWNVRGSRLAGRHSLAAFDFPTGSLVLTEAGTKKRASLHLVRGSQGLQLLNPGGIEPLDCSLEEFTHALTSENHTLKRALTDPTLFSGIGNAYSDEILHAARLSPVALTQRLSPEEINRLWSSVKVTLRKWVEKLRGETGDAFPENVTAFRPDMAVHGRFGKPCPVCGTAVQRIRHADNETNYCPQCQTDGRLLADRGLSRLLREDWPKSVEELENLRAGRLKR